MEKIITNSGELSLLLKGDQKLRFRFEFPSLGKAQNKHWEQEVKKDYYANGGGMAVVFLALTFLGAACYHIYNWVYLDKDLGRLETICTFLTVLLATMLGQLIGKETAWLRLKKKLKTLNEVLDGESIYQF